MHLPHWQLLAHCSNWYNDWLHIAALDHQLMRLGSVFIPMAALPLPDTLLFNAFCQIAIPLAVTAGIKSFRPYSNHPNRWW